MSSVQSSSRTPFESFIDNPLSNISVQMRDFMHAPRGRAGARCAEGVPPEHRVRKMRK